MLFRSFLIPLHRLFSTFFFHSVFIVSALHFQVSAMDSGFSIFFRSDFYFPYFAWPVSSIWHLRRLFVFRCIVTMCIHNSCHCECFFRRCIFIFAVVARCSLLLWLLLLFLSSPVFFCNWCVLCVFCVGERKSKKRRRRRATDVKEAKEPT